MWCYVAPLRWKAERNRDLAAVSSTSPRKCFSMDATRFRPSSSPLPAFTVGMICSPHVTQGVVSILGDDVLECCLVSGRSCC